MRQSYRGFAIAGIFSLFCTFGALASPVYAATAGGGGGGNTGTWITLDAPGSTRTEAWGLSGNSIVGFYTDASERKHGFLYSMTTKTWTTLDAPGATDTLPTDLDGNNIVGNSTAVGGFLYNGATWTTLDAPPGATGIEALGIDGNNIVGFYVDDHLIRRHGFLYNMTTKTWTTLDAPGAGNTWASGISGNDIVGWYHDASETTFRDHHGFIYNGTTWINLTMPGMSRVFPQDISGNNIVGDYEVTLFGFHHGFIYNGTTWTTLDAPGAIMTSVRGISGNSIVGFYTDASGKAHGFIYTISESTPPTPPSDDGAWHIQDNATGGDCTSIGTWNVSAKTCTLSRDLTQGMIIDSNGVTLDGNGRTIAGTGGSGAGVGVYLSGRTGVTIKNVNVQKFRDGIRLDFSSHDNTLTGNAISNNVVGIFLTSSNNNTLTNNVASNNNSFPGIELNFSNGNILTGNTASNNAGDGIYLEDSHNNTLTGNTASDNGGTGIFLHIRSNNNTLTGNIASNNTNDGIFILVSTNNTLTGNTASNNQLAGIRLLSASSNRIYNNNFISNATQAFFDTTANVDNVFNLASPIGGNYWNDYDTPAEGCNNTNADNFCDAPRTFTGGQDNLPWTKKDGWLAGPPNPPPQDGAWNIRDDASGGDCASIGTWSAQTKTCVLTQDLNQGVVIDSDNIILDGNGRTITGGNTGSGVFLSGRTGVTIKNLNVQKFSQGILLDDSSNNTLTGNTASNNSDGIALSYSSVRTSNDNILTDNTVSDNYDHGIHLDASRNNVLTDNTASNNNVGIYLSFSSNNTLTGNTVSNNKSYGIFLHSSGISSGGNIASIGNTLTDNTVSNNNVGVVLSTSVNNKIYNNNFINNATQAVVEYSYLGHVFSGNVFNLASPIGGNYWSDYDTPAEGCNNINGDAFCDAPYIYSIGQDNLPWTKKDGWLTESGSHITVLSPNGGEIWEIGKTYEIRWDGADFPANTRVQIGLRDSRFDPNLGPGEGAIADTTNTSSYLFTVPQSLGFLSDGQLGGDNSYTVVVYVDGGGPPEKFDESDAKFSIVPAGESENHLPSIFALKQSSVTWQNGIPEDHYINDTTITFSAILDDFDEGQLQLQVELRKFDEPFTGAIDGGILTSGSVEAESVATVTRGGLTPGSYHWRARAIDASNMTSDWGEFGESGNVDFTIASTIISLSPLQSVLPGVSCPPEKHLVFITHGWDDDSKGWVKDMALSIKNYIDAHATNPGDWGVCTFDWSEDAAMVDFTRGDLLVPPWDAFAKAGLDGRIAGAELAKNNYESIHFIGHSAGSNVIQAAAETVRSNTPATKIHLTFLDAYDPNNISSLYGVEPLRNGFPIPNRSDWWAEQYVDKRGKSVLAPTNIYLPHAYNFDVTERDGFQNPSTETVIENEIASAQKTWQFIKIANDHKEYLTRVHGWPYIWYQNSITWPSAPSSDEPLAVYGHHLSLEGGKDSLPLEFPNVAPLNVCTFKKDSGVSCPTSNTRTGSSVNYLPAFNIQGNISRQSETGNVTFLNSNAAQATPGSPVWFELSATTTDATNVLRFAYGFISVPGSENILTVFVDDKVVYKIDERITDPGVHTASEIIVGDLASGEHTIGFRLDPFTDAKSPIEIRNIQLGLLTQEAIVVNTSVKGLLEDALAKLKSITTGDRDIDTATDAVEKDIEKLIADRAWLDRNHLSWPGGLTTLISETGVVRALGDILNKAEQRKNSIPVATQTLYRDAQNEIVQSAALLAKLSFDKAKAVRAKSSVGRITAPDMSITRIQSTLDRATAMELDRPEQAVRLYGEAWFSSETISQVSSTMPLQTVPIPARPASPRI